MIAAMIARGTLLVCLALLVPARVGAQDAATPAPRHARAASPSRPTQSGETEALLHQLADAQRALGEQMQQLRDSVDALRSDLSEREDQDTGIDQDVKALRDEVKGLYVEDSTLKQQIDSLREDVDGVNSNVSAFRTFAGLFLATMILLLLLVLALTIRR